MSIRTFERVSGPKTDNWTGKEADHWLVYTVGVLITVGALVLLLAAWRRNPSAEVALLAIGMAAGLTAIDVIYVARGVIWPIYLLDAAIEVVLIAAWGALLVADARMKKPRSETAAKT